MGSLNQHLNTSNNTIRCTAIGFRYFSSENRMSDFIRVGQEAVITYSDLAYSGREYRIEGGVITVGQKSWPIKSVGVGFSGSVVALYIADPHSVRDEDEIMKVYTDIWSLSEELQRLIGRKPRELVGDPARW